MTDHVPAPGGGAPRVVGFVCDWAVSTAGLTDAAGRLLAHPSVVLIQVPCSGFIRPSWLEETLRAGAEGVFVVGCPYGDCLNREGNYLMRERIEQLQRRLQRRKVEPERLSMLAHGLHDREAFLADVGALVEALGRLGAAAGVRPVPPRAAVPSAAPAEEGNP
ncbi:MAG: hydrogenase iron-sulfur subunit [Armatimonadota bacterium]|nr:hydrogenase iron-sulfur subunit [Armatimonadota bacterium]MDR7520617.1 hydrogenase iron-sulfur subunit [Armatimonadota bacterium]MDR7550490.1 hydrogenase iron-sulfur subunit [Armatimonadota bacterium]